MGSSPETQRLRLQVRRIGPHFRTVLISGEAGAGKRRIARALHARSRAANGPFVACHGAALEVAAAAYGSQGRGADAPDALGYLHRVAQQGTLFLDAINEMPLQDRLRLLRLLRRQDAADATRLQLRIIATTSESLKILAAAGRFQQELYERLAMVEISLPPLRNRKEDLLALAEQLLSQFAALHGRQAPAISEQAMEQMQSYYWPGNVTELKDVLQSSLLRIEGGVLEPHHLPAFREEAVPAPYLKTNSARLQDVVEQHVLRVLQDCKGNKVRAAEVLGISRSTLYRMLDATSAAVMPRASTKHSPR
ncbi:sigma 54-interacting transcriptional regulator [Granulicella sp. S190]|uniref:sigma 54-interacting transcriptional regulator n=1 Tax=Granulicella sp. S190 TaxID=1747226 RepID=UPI00131AA6EB|nr:sigma 54-interacting transcriptional regulator [Granulicella sp. S190]